MKRLLVLLLLSSAAFAASRAHAKTKRNDNPLRSSGGTTSIIRVNGRDHVLFVPYPSDVNESQYEEVAELSPPTKKSLKVNK